MRFKSKALLGAATGAVAGRTGAGACMLALSCVSVLSAPAHAQTAAAPPPPSETAADDGRLEEIVVTARRQSETLREIPTSISVFNTADLVKNNIRGIGDYALKSPNIAIQEGPTRSENNISIRGISNIGSGLNTSFAFYVDELNVISISSNPQLQDIERVEVLRGPQGTFFGRNAAGGAINISTRKPGPELGGNASLEYASFDTWEGTAVVNLPLTDSFFLRAVGNYYETDGFIRNVNPVGGSNDERNVQGRLAARWLASDRLTFDLSFTKADEESGLENGVPTHILYPATRNLIRTSVPVTDGLPPYPRNRRLVNQNNPKQADFDFTIWNGRVSLDAGPFTITSVTGYGENQRVATGDVDATSRDAVNISRATERESFSQELRLASASRNPIRWVLGGIYADERRDGDLSVIAGSQSPIPVPSGTVIRRTLEDGKTESWAVFGEADWHVTDRLTLTYGGRYSSDEVTQAQTITSAGPMGLRQQVFAPVSKSFDAYTSKFAARYDLSEQVTAYAVASQGYRTGGVQLDPALVNPSFEPEKLWNYEAGLKGTLFDQRLRFSASGFYIDWTDLQVQTNVNRLDPATGALVLTNGIENAASASSLGAELELRAKPADMLELGFTAGYLDSKYDSYPAARITDARGTIDLSDKRLLNSPKWSLSADAQLNFDIGEARAFVRGEWAYRSSIVSDNIVYVPVSAWIVPVTEAFSFPYRIPGFGVWNFRAGATWGRYSLTAYVQNAFNRNYYTGTFDDLYQSGTHVRVQPRRFGIRLAAEF